MTNRRIEMHHYRDILVRMRFGQSSRQLAKQRIIGRRKTQQIKDIAEVNGWLDPKVPLPDNEILAKAFMANEPKPSTTSLVEPYRKSVEDWVEQGVLATRIHQVLVSKHNFCGSYSSVQRFVKQLAAETPAYTTIIDFEPGDSAQVDFGMGPRIVDRDTGELRKTWVFVMTLSWSRHMYAELVWDQRVETWLACHRRAFEWFGAVPSRVIIDNLKSAITKASYYEPTVQRAYAECAEGYGFLIAPCPVADPQKKGRVESGVKYVKNAFVPLREFRSLSDANQQLREWVMAVAGNRTHGTTRKRPLSQFVDVEKFLMKPLPDVPPELARWQQLKIHSDCHIQFNYNRYSVPYHHVGKQVWVRISETTVRIYLEHELIAVHSRLKHSGDRSTLDEHLPPQALAYKMQAPQWCLQQARLVGENCFMLIERLFRNRVMDNLRAAQGVISFRKRYGDVRLEAACYRALHFDNVTYTAVKQILQKGLDQQHDLQASFDSLADSYTGGGRFNRNLKNILSH